MNLQGTKWKEFFISGNDGIFQITATSSGADKNKLDLSDGKIPYITRSNENNGINLFIPDGQKASNGNAAAKDQKLIKDKGNTITIGLDTQTAFYQPHDFYTGQNIHVLKYQYMDRDVAQFIVTMLKVQLQKFSWGGNGATLGRLARTKIMLPVNKNDEPDVDFMRNYSKALKKSLSDKYIQYCKNKLKLLGDITEIPSLTDKTWSDFSIVKIFDKFQAGKSKGLNHLSTVKNGGIQYIAATNRNNGVSCFVKEDDTSKKYIQKGNCIGFIKNGDGSAGYAIYKAKQFISTSDVIFGYADWLDEFTGLFFVAAQDMIQDKYSHGYKRNQQHLKGDKVMLPSNDNGEPDYDYMRQYMKNLMIKKYQSYLDYTK